MAWAVAHLGAVRGRKASQQAGRKEGRERPFLAPSFVLFPIGQRLYQRSSRASQLHHLAPAVAAQQARSQTLSSDATFDPEIAGCAKTQGMQLGSPVVCS